MEPSPNSPIVGLDILQCPIEEIAPAASEVPLPNLEWHGIDISSSPHHHRTAQTGLPSLARPKFLRMPATSLLNFDLQDSLLCVLLKGLQGLLLWRREDGGICWVQLKFRVIRQALLMIQGELPTRELQTPVFGPNGPDAYLQLMMLQIFQSCMIRQSCPCLPARAFARLRCACQYFACCCVGLYSAFQIALAYAHWRQAACTAASNLFG